MNPISKDATIPDHSGDLRAAIRGDMLRANTAVAVVLSALIILVLAAGVAAFRATRNLQRAQAAEARGKERLASAYLAQARATRLAAEPDRKETALNAVKNAAAISRTKELRSEAIACLALTDLTPDGALIATPRNIVNSATDEAFEQFAFADLEGTITICNSSGNPLFTLKTGHAIGGMMFSPDGQRLAVRFANQTVGIWDVKLRRALDGPPLKAVTLSSFSPDSQWLIFSDAARNGQIALYNLKTFEMLDKPITAGPNLFRLDRGWRIAAVCNGLAVDIIDFQTGTNIATLSQAARPVMLAWSSDGQKLAVSCENGDVYLWDMATQSHKILTGHSDRCVSMGFSRDDTMLYSGSLDGTTRLWDISLGQTIAVGEGIAHGFTADGQRLGFWRPWAGFGIWRVSSSAFYSRLPCDVAEGPLRSLDLSASGRWCVAAQNKGFRIWDLRGPQKRMFVREADVTGISISPDERSLFVSSMNGLAAWPLDMDSQGDLDLQPAHAKPIPLPDGQGARAVAVSLNGQILAVELMDQRLAVLDMAGRKPPVFLKSRWRYVYSKGPGSATGAGRFAISPDGRWVATGFDFGDEDVPEVWDAASGALAARLDAPTSVVGFSTDGKWLVLGGTDQYSVWSIGTWRRQKVIDRDEPAITHGAVALIASNETLALAKTRKVVEIRDSVANTALADLISPVPQSINSIHASLDGSMLVTATASDMVEVWRLDGLRKQLAALGLDWGTAPPSMAIGGIATPQISGALTLTWLAILAVFVLAAAFMLTTLRRHRLAIRRFLRAEAATAQTNRELDMAKVELMHSQKMQALGTLAAGIAHDFNNLLSVIRMSNQLVERRTANDAEIQEHVADIEQAVLQGKGVVSSMLGYARENGGNDEPVDVNSVVENVVSLLSREFLGGIALILELERETPRVMASRGMLEQILLNLVVNASEAMQGRGKLKIIVQARFSLPDGEYVLRPRPAHEFVELSVIDSGPGIAPEARDRLFEPFFTTKRTGSKVGTGLGLSLVYSMIQQAEAGLMVKSNPGEGAAFTLLFPAFAPEPVRQTHSSQTGGKQ